MADSRDKYIKDILKSLMTMDYINPEDVPNIDLYMDQVTTFMDRHLESSKRFEDDKLLTKTMINNYAKNNLIPAPEKKKYSQDHMYLLIFIYYMKNIMSISDIQTLLGPMTEYFFNQPDFDMGDAYKEIFDMEDSLSKDMVKDILDKINSSKNTFKGVAKTPEEEEYLRIFSFICMLCFDVYMKKQIIEKLIDNSACFQKKDPAAVKKEEAARKKEEAAKKKEEAKEKK